MIEVLERLQTKTITISYWHHLPRLFKNMTRMQKRYLSKIFNIKGKSLTSTNIGRLQNKRPFQEGKDPIT